MANVDFNNIAPWGAMARCVVNPDQTVAYFLDKDDSNLKADGTSVNWSEVESNGQNVMVEIPKFYYTKKKVGDDFNFGVAMEPVEVDGVALEDWEVHPAFFRDRENLCDVATGTAVEVDFRYAPAFKGWVDGQGRLRSLPNKQPTVDKDIGTFRNHAKNMGVGWSQMDFNLQFAIQMLYITEYGHPDSQTEIGKGWTGASAAATTGATLNRGNNTYGTTSDNIQISYRGIEDWWGNVRTWLDGCYYDNNYNTLIGNKGYNNTGSGYANMGNNGVGATVNGNIREIHDAAGAGFTTKRSGGGHETDGLHDYGTLSSGCLPNAGGNWARGASAGAFYSASDRTSNSTSTLGASISL